MRKRFSAFLKYIYTQYESYISAIININLREGSEVKRLRRANDYI